MSLENEIATLTLAVKELTAALTASNQQIARAVAPVSDTAPVVLTYTPEVQEAAKEVVKAVEQAVVAPKAETPAPAAALPTRDDLRGIAKTRMSKAGGTDKVKAVLAELAVKSITDCPDDKLVALKAKLEEIA